MSENLMETWDDIISRAARWTAHDFPNVTSDDLYQDLWVFVLETPALDPNNPGVYTVLARKAKTIAWDQRRADLQFTAQYSYRTSDVREILEGIYEYESWARGYCPADAIGGDRMGSVDVRADVTWAMEKLPSQYREIIESRYRNNTQFEAHSAERRRLNRAIKRLTDTLNSYYRGSALAGHPGRRKVITNAQAQYIMDGNDNG